MAEIKSSTTDSRVIVAASDKMLDNVNTAFNLAISTIPVELWTKKEVLSYSHLMLSDASDSTDVIKYANETIASLENINAQVKSDKVSLLISTIKAYKEFRVNPDSFTSSNFSDPKIKQIVQESSSNKESVEVVLPKTVSTSVATPTEVPIGTEIPVSKPTPSEKLTTSSEILKNARDNGWISAGGSILPGACKIGSIWLPVPPTNISITELNENEVIPTFRTAGNPKRKTSAQQIRIEMEIYFPSLYDINKRLRPLLAQFMRAPFVPLENKHIRNLVLPGTIRGEYKKANTPESTIKSDKVEDIDYSKLFSDKLKQQSDAIDAEISKLQADLEHIKSKATGTEIQQSEGEPPVLKETYKTLFVKKIKPLADAAQSTYGYSSEAIIKISANESAWGKSGLAKRYNGYFGIKTGTGWTGPKWDNAPTAEVVDSHEVKINAPFRAYEDITESFADFINLLNLPMYDNLRDKLKTGTLKEIGEQMFACGYSTNPQYSTIMESIVIPSVDVADADIAVESERLQLMNKIRQLNNKKKYLLNDVFAEVVLNSSDSSVYNDVQLTVACNNVVISTIPGFPEALQCNLTLTLFNFLPYSDDFSFVKTMQDALKQIEYYNSKHYLQFDIDERKSDGVVIYKKPSIETTKDMGKSEPFIAYVTPLLTGEALEINEDIILKDDTNKDCNIKKKLIFLAPTNWLRSVYDVNEFKQIRWTYEITESSQELIEEMNLRLAKDRTNILIKLAALITQPGITRTAIENIKFQIDSLLTDFVKLITLQTFDKRVLLTKMEMSNMQTWDIMVTKPLTLPGDKNPILPRGRTSVGVVIAVLKTRFPGVEGIIDEYRKMIIDEYNSIMQWNHIYRLNINENEKTVITGVSANLGHRLVNIPLLNYNIPTMQHMGRSDWNIQINMQTCDIELLSKLKTLSTKAAISRLFRTRSKKEWYINKTNSLMIDLDGESNGFFKLIGCSRALFTDFVYETVRNKPGWWNVTIRLVQNDIDLFLYESLYPVNMYDDKVIADTMYWLMKKYSPVLTSGFALPDKCPYIVRYIFNDMRSAMLRIFLNILYGGESTVPTISSAIVTNQNINMSNQLIPKHIKKGKLVPTNTITVYFNSEQYIIPLIDGENGTFYAQLRDKFNSKFSSDASSNVFLHLDFGTSDSTEFIKIAYNNKAFGFATLEQALIKTYDSSGAKTDSININDVNDPKVNFDLQLPKVLIEMQKQDIFSDNSVNKAFMFDDADITYIFNNLKLDLGRTLSFIEQKIRDSYGGRLDSNMAARMNGFRLGKFLGVSLQVDDHGAMWTMLNKFMYSLALKTILFAKKELIELSEGNIQLQDLYPKGLLQRDLSSQYTSSYPDLELPISLGGVFSTPADFYFKKYESTINKEIISNKVDAVWDLASASWLLSDSRGFFVLDQLYNVGDVSIKDVDNIKSHILQIAGIRDAEYTKDQLFKGLLSKNEPSNMKATYNVVKKRLKKLEKKQMELINSRNKKLKNTVEKNAIPYKNLEAIEAVGTEIKIETEILQDYEEYMKTMDSLKGEITKLHERLNEYDAYLDSLKKIEVLNKVKNFSDSPEDESTKAALTSGMQFTYSQPSIDLIVETGEKLADAFIQLQNKFKSMSSDELAALTANRSSYDIKQVYSINLLMKIGSLYKELTEDGKVKLKQDLNNAVVLDELRAKMVDYIIQVQNLYNLDVTSVYGVVTPWTANKLESAKERVFKEYDIIKSRDKLKCMERAFPVLKLFFIEEDDRAWGALDDYYVYNSIQNIEIVRSKHAASSVANIVLSNISGNLTDESSTTRNEAPLKDQTASEQTMFSLLVRPGTTIMIKGGYDNHFENLTCMFIGKVISSSLGQQITIVAQSFGAELLEPINNGVQTKCGYFSVARTHGDVVLYAIGTLQGLEHFGSISAYEQFGFTGTGRNDGVVTVQKWRAVDMIRSIHPITDFYYKFGVSDPRIENIYLPYSVLCMTPINRSIAAMFMEIGLQKDGNTKVIGNDGQMYDAFTNKGVTLQLSKEILNVPALVGLFSGLAVATCMVAILAWPVTVLTVGGVVLVGAGMAALFAFLNNKDWQRHLLYRGTYDWVIPGNTTLWDLLNEISLYHEDYIVTTLPYNENVPGMTRETLYVGPRDGYYKYTDAYNDEQQRTDTLASIERRRALYTEYLTSGKIRDIQKKNSNAKTELLKLDNKKIKNVLIDEDAEKYNRLQRDIEETKRVIDTYEHYKYVSKSEDSGYDKGNFTNKDTILMNIENPYDIIDLNTGRPGFRGYKSLVNYHFVDGYYDIIENNIYASAEEVSNHVVIKYPKNPNFDERSATQMNEFFADDNIRGGNMRTYVSTQMNVDPWSYPFLAGDLMLYYEINKSMSAIGYNFRNLPRVYMIGNNVLANHMRPMYRGELKVIGMPSVKPYDIMFIYDSYNDMWGPIEVETVKHRFSSEGFTTSIVPHAVVGYMNPGKMLELNMMNGLRINTGPLSIDLLGNPMNSQLQILAGGVGAGALFGLTVSKNVTGMLVSMGGGLIAGAYLGAKAFNLWSWTLNKVMGRDLLHLCGLWLGNMPLSAGLEGAYKDDILVHFGDSIRKLFDLQLTVDGIY